MSGTTLILDSIATKQRAIAWINKAPTGTRLELKEAKRTIPQNDRMWAMLTDVARQATHHGVKLSPDDWKILFMEALGHEMRMVPNLDGNGLVALGRSSSRLSKQEMADLMTLIEAYCASHGIDLGNQKDAA